MFRLRALIVIVTLVLTVLLGVGVAFAQGVQPPPVQIPTLLQFVGLLATGAFLGPVLSYLFEKADWFQNKLTGTQRLFVIAGLCFAVPVVGQVLLDVVPPGFWTMAEKYWQVLAAGAVWFLAATGYHLWSKSAH